MGGTGGKDKMVDGTEGQRTKREGTDPAPDFKDMDEGAICTACTRDHPDPVAGTTPEKVGKGGKGMGEHGGDWKKG